MDTEGSTQTDTVLSVYASCAGPEIACDDDSGTGNLSSLTFAATAGTTYYIRVASYSAGCGGFNLNITHAPCGACCYADYTCALATEAACTGTWLGADVPCTQCPPPPQTGACCYSDYTCALTTEAGCTGIWLGADVPCSQCPPPPPTGACCYPDYTCAVTTEAICTGIWLGADVPCTQCPPPPQTGACCYADYTCAVTTQLECTGMWLGANVPCEQCPPAPSVCAGDLNCDGSINFRDINPFVLHLSNFSAWQATYPGCPAANGDTNGDGTWSSFRDINPFVALLSAQPPPQCP